MYTTDYPSPLGRLTLASDGQNLTGLWIEDQKYFGGRHTDFRPGDDLPSLAAAKAWLDRYFAGEKPDPAELPLRPDGSAFRQTVWAHLLRIPYGALVTYGALAKAIAAQTGRQISAQAVAAPSDTTRSRSSSPATAL